MFENLRLFFIVLLIQFFRVSKKNAFSFNFHFRSKYRSFFSGHKRLEQRRNYIRFLLLCENFSVQNNETKWQHTEIADKTDFVLRVKYG